MTELHTYDVDETREARCRIRRLDERDLRRVVAIDELVTGHERRGYYERKLRPDLPDTNVEVSLGAEVDGILVGFVLARVWTGEFGATEPVAVLDTLGVQPAFQHQGVGEALLDQLATNLRGLGVHTVRTEVDWDGFELLRFFHRRGFRPAARLCLELELDAGAPGP